MKVTHVHEEPPKKKLREESSMLVGMAKVAGAEALSPFKQRVGYQKSPERKQPPYQRQR